MASAAGFAVAESLSWQRPQYLPRIVRASAWSAARSSARADEAHRSRATQSFIVAPVARAGAALQVARLRLAPGSLPSAPALAPSLLQPCTLAPPSHPV